MATAPVDPILLPAERLTAHQPPALLVARVLSVAETGGVVRLKDHGGLDALQLLEAGAQAIAVLMGARMRQGGGDAAASGMLVGAKDVSVRRCPAPGEDIDIATRCTHELGALQLHEVVATATATGEELLRAELKVAATGGAAA